MGNNGSTALLYAAQEGKDAVATQLLQAKANPAAVNKYGQTPAQIAELRGHTELAARLRQAASGAASQ